MYLAPYIACVLAWAAATVYAVYRKESTSPYTTSGKIARFVLSILLAALVAALWRYTGEEYLKNETVHFWVKVVSVIAFLCALPEIWLEGNKGDR